MANVVFVWELGGGLGHLTQMLPLAQGIVGLGHRVAAVVRNPAKAAEVFGDLAVELFQSPVKMESRIYFPGGIGFAHFLANISLWDRHESQGLISAWRNLFGLLQPDLVIFDHSPTALAAARGLKIRRALIGSGFCCPPDVFPLPLVKQNATKEELERLPGEERKILQRFNAISVRWDQPPLERLGQIFGEVDETFLTTFPELDHYPGRRGGRYWGPVNGSGGKRVEWPAGNGPRIFAYLKSFPALGELLEVLNRRGDPTVIYSSEINVKTQKTYASETLRFESERLDIGRVARECDVAILNAGHGSTCDMLLAGKPILQIPLNPEQRLVAEAVERMRTGVMISKESDGEGLEEGLSRLLMDDSYKDAAGRFAMRHADFDPNRQREEMLARALELVG